MRPGKESRTQFYSTTHISMKKYIVTLVAFLPLVMSCQKDIQSFDYAIHLSQSTVENEIVASYMSEVNYTDGDYTYSMIKPYYDSKNFTSPKKYAPRAIEISWTPNAEAYTSQKVTITDDRSFERRFDLTSFQRNIRIYNLIPGKDYRFVLYGLNRSTSHFDSLSCFIFKPQGQVRMINVPGVNNVRDMGGWKSAVYNHQDGSPKTVRYGRLYRGGELDRKTKLSDEAMDILINDMKIGADADFRNDTECSGIAGSALPKVDYHRISTAMYAASASSSTHADNFRWILSRLREGKNVYYHCAAGADRTGTMAHLLEGVLGVCENDQCKDWELTCFYSWRSRVYGETYDYGSMIRTYFAIFNGNTTAENCVAYFKKYGITDAELDEFRSIMLE